MTKLLTARVGDKMGVETTTSKANTRQQRLAQQELAEPHDYFSINLVQHDY